MTKPAKPLAFRFRGKREDSGADRFPGCVTFEIYMQGRAYDAVMEWLNETCPQGYQFGTAKKWARMRGGKPYQYEVRVLHIMDRGVAAMFKMAFAKTEQQMREYYAAKGRTSYQRRRAA